MPSIEFVVLAKSRKHGGRCVAGLRTDGEGWIRPVSNLSDGRLSWSSCILDTRKEVALLNVIRVDVKQPKPSDHQPENWELVGTKWKLVSETAASHVLLRLVPPAVTSGPELFLGALDRVSVERVRREPVKASLAIVYPPRLRLHATTSFRGNPQVRGEFLLGETPHRYDLVVTDSDWEAYVHKHGEVVLMQAPQRPVFVTVSLGEPFEDHHYKLIAAIVPSPRML